MDDALNEVILEIENERLERRIELVQNATQDWNTRDKITEELKKLLQTQIRLENESIASTESSHIDIEKFNIRDFKYGLTAFMMNKITEFITNNQTFTSINDVNIKKSFI